MNKFQQAMGFTLGVFVASSVPFSSNEAIAATHCYDFSGPGVNTIYQLGQTINTNHATIHMRKFLTVNGPSQSNIQEGRIDNSSHAEGTAPELDLQSIVAQIIPVQGVQKLELLYADNTGGAYQQNFGVNGDRRVLQGGLGQLDGEEMGKPLSGGKVNVSVTTNAKPGGNWTYGKLTLTALPGRAIERVSIGGSSQFLIDNVCLQL